MKTLSKCRAPSTTPGILVQVILETNGRKHIFWAEKDLLQLQREAWAWVILSLSKSSSPWLEEWVSEWTKTQVPIRSQLLQGLITDTGPSEGQDALTKKRSRCCRCFRSVAHTWSPAQGCITKQSVGVLLLGNGICHDWKLLCSSTWKNKVTTKIKGSSMLWVLEMANLRGYTWRQYVLFLTLTRECF